MAERGHWAHTSAFVGLIDREEDRTLRARCSCDPARNGAELASDRDSRWRWEAVRKKKGRTWEARPLLFFSVFF